MGLAVLAAAPIVAAALTSSTPGRTLASAPLTSRFTAAGQVSEIVPLPAARVLRLHAPFPAPAPPPAPPPPRRKRVSIPSTSWPNTQVVAIIIAAAQRWGLDPNYLLKIANCESHFHPNDYNPRGPYYGLFQFLMSTFLHNGGTNIWDPADQANIAAKMIAHGQAHQWSCA